MEYWQCEGLCYNYDEKYVKGIRCHEQKLIHMDVNSTPVVEYLDQEEPSKAEATDKPLPSPATIEPATSPDEAIISLHALSGISTP